MDVVGRHGKDKIAYTIKVLVNCSSSDAYTAADQICQDPEAVALLALACGVSTYGMVGGFEATKAAAIAQAWPLAISGAAITGASALAAKRFCSGMIRQGADAISQGTKMELRSSIIGY